MNEEGFHATRPSSRLAIGSNSCATWPEPGLPGRKGRLSELSADQAALRQFAHELIVRQSVFEPPDGTLWSGIQGLYGALARDDCRNELIINDVIKALEAGRSPLVLTERLRLLCLRRA